MKLDFFLWPLQVVGTLHCSCRLTAVSARYTFEFSMNFLKGIFGGDDSSKNTGPINISAPYDFKHLEHARADPHSSTGISVSGENKL